MNGRRGAFRRSALHTATWVLVGAQVVVTGTSIWWQLNARYAFRRQAAHVLAELRRAHAQPVTMPNPQLVRGMRVPAIPVQTAGGSEIDLCKQIKGRGAILFVSSCAPCVADLLGRFEGLWRRGFDVKVIARIPPHQIQEARRRYGWRLPIYSDARLPQAAAACRVSYRPAALVLSSAGRVLYAQETNDDREAAFNSIARCLSGAG